MDVKIKNQTIAEFLNSLLDVNSNDHLINTAKVSLNACEGLANSLKVYKNTLEPEDSADNPEKNGEATKASGERKREEFSEEKLKDQLEQIETSMSSLARDVTSHMESEDTSLTKLETLVTKCVQIESCQSYLRCIDHIEHLSCSLQSAILVDSNVKAIDCYQEMVSLFEKLRGSTCKNLLEYLKNTIRFWSTTLKDRLNKELSSVMKSMEWPFVAALSSQKAKPSATSSEPAAIKSNLTRIFHQLLSIRLPSDIAEQVLLHPMIASIPNYKQPIEPIAMLVEPLKKRFQYHFYGNKPTNNIEKPEWFFTQLLTWAKAHADCITTVIQPALWDAGYDFVNGHIEFLRSLHTIAMEKLITCVPDIMYDEHLYSHLIRETLSFHSDMCTAHDYPPDEPTCLHILTAEETFKKWIIIEKKFAQEKMDTITSSPTAWTSQFNAELEDDDQFKAVECAESFITLLTTITERYEHLPYAVCQLMFVCMKQELLEDFRVRLVQLRKEFSTTSAPYLAILNTSHYIVSFLKEWTERPFFIKLQYQARLLSLDNSQLSTLLPTLLSRDASYQLPSSINVDDIDDLECTLFNTSIANISSLEDEMLKSLAHHVTTDLKAKLRTYADNSQSMWTALSHLKHKEEQHMVTLSATACDFIIYLESSLVLGFEALQQQLFAQFWQQVVQELDRLIFHLVIAENHFSEGGVVQFKFDMTRNLFPVVGRYTSKPENFLKMVKESCHLLSMQLGDALLLKSALADSLHSLNSKTPQDPIATIQEQNVFKLDPEEAELVLSRRTDLLRNY